MKKPKCNQCGQLGHEKKDCCYKKKNTRPRKNKEKAIVDAASPKKEASSTQKEINVMHIDVEEEILAAHDPDEEMSDNPFYENLSQYNMHFIDMNEISHMYDWLADSRATYHISNRCEHFSSYEQTPGAIVYSIGGNITKVEGQGTVYLITQYGVQRRILHLDHVNHIPNNKYNIFALGRWATQGYTYKATNTGIMLYNKENKPILEGQKIASNLCHSRLIPKDTTASPKHMYTLTVYKKKQTWET